MTTILPKTLPLQRFRGVILGCPGSGKGTHTAWLEKDFNTTTISVGNLLRNHVNNKTSLGLQIEENMKNGKLVPNNLLFSFMRKELDDNNDRAWILDGFPRNLDQAIFLEELLAQKNEKLDLCIFIDVPAKVLLSRLEERWIHVPSGRIYNESFNPPKVRYFDDLTGEPLHQRDDDAKATVLERIRKFELETAPVIEYYRKKDICRTFTGDNSISLYSNIKSMMNKFQIAS